jgi:predicted outer membrane protein
MALGRMAQGKASTEELREYANQLVKERTSADQQVIAMAKKKNLRLREHDIQKWSERAGLNALSGPLFDKFFLQQTAADQPQARTGERQRRRCRSFDRRDSSYPGTRPRTHSIPYEEGAGLAT